MYLPNAIRLGFLLTDFKAEDKVPTTLEKTSRCIVLSFHLQIELNLSLFQPNKSKSLQTFIVSLNVLIRMNSEQTGFHGKEQTVGGFRTQFPHHHSSAVEMVLMLEEM